MLKSFFLIPVIVVFFSSLCNVGRGQSLPTPRLNLPESAVKPKVIMWAYIAGAGLIALGGVADGYNQVQRHHYYIFAEKHPDHNPLFWGPDQWLNKWELDANGKIIPNENTGWLEPKYKERFWGSSRWLVFATDAHHLTRTVDITATLSGVTLVNIADRDKQLWQYMAEFAGSFIIRSTAFWIVHDVVYK